MDNLSFFQVILNHLEDFPTEQLEQLQKEIRAILNPRDTSTIAVEFSADDKVLIEIYRNHSKLHAIKHYKDKTGLGLKEAKDYIDALILSVEQDFSSLPIVEQRIIDECKGYMRMGNKLQAVKHYYSYKKDVGETVGLKEAKDFIESLII